MITKSICVLCGHIPYALISLVSVVYGLTASAQPTSTTDSQYRWYVPQEADQKIAWNTHDPWNTWGSSTALSISYTGSLIEDTNIPALKGSLGAFSLDYASSSNYWMLRAYFGDNTELSSITSYDLNLPDLKIGLLRPSVNVSTYYIEKAIPSALDIKNITDGLILSAEVPLLRARVVFEDFIFVDLSLLSLVGSMHFLSRLKTEEELSESFSSDESTHDIGFKFTFLKKFTINAGVVF